MVKLVADLLVQGGQGMEGDLRRDVMFGVIVHVPHHGFQPLPGQGGARVLPQIGAFRKTAVLGEVVPATEGLTNEAGQQPVDHRRPGAEIDRGSGNGGIDGPRYTAPL